MKGASEAAVSVVMPVYNQEAFLAECMDSVLTQTLRAIEVVCVDDGSTDGSGRILREYAARDRRVKVVRQRNAGAGPARNAGVAASRGEYVAFMDPDDMYPDGRVLEDLFRAASESGAKACGGSFSEFLPNGAERTRYDGSVYGMSFAADGFVDYRDWQFDYGFCRFLYSRRMLDEAGVRFPPYARYQDPPFFVKAMAAAGRFYALGRVVYRCRVVGRRVDWRAQGGRRFKALCDGVRDVADFARENGLERLFALQRERVLRDFGDLFFDDGLCGMARWRTWRLFGSLGLKCRERRWKPWLGLAPSSLNSYVDREEPRLDLLGEDERLRRLYEGDVVNFGKAYADGMAEIRRGGCGNG